MRTLVFNTDPAPRALHDRRIFWVENGVVRTKVVMVVGSRPLADMLVEVEDGTSEVDVREAIQAAALVEDWKLANEIVTRYGISACLRCAADVANRPTWRLFWIAKAAGIPLPYRQPKQENESWGEICGTCAIWMMQNYP